MSEMSEISFFNTAMMYSPRVFGSASHLRNTMFRVRTKTDNSTMR